jgi:adenosylhomocysteine nucleosidase
LRARFTPLITGIGPVEAALYTGVALARLEAAGQLPDLIVCLGSAGSRRCALGSGPPDRQRLVARHGRLAARHRARRGALSGRAERASIGNPAGPPVATLSSGGDVVSGDHWDRVSADMVDMETYAVAAPRAPSACR